MAIITIELWRFVMCIILIYSKEIDEKKCVSFEQSNK